MSTKPFLRTEFGRLWRAAAVAALTLSVLPAGPPPKVASFSESDRAYWAFQKVKRPAVPVLDSAWVRNPIDALILKSSRRWASSRRPRPTSRR